jgi:hypothetical protein
MQDGFIMVKIIFSPPEESPVIFRYSSQYHIRKWIPAKSRLSENETIMPASKSRRLKEDHFGDFYPGVCQSFYFSPTEESPVIFRDSSAVSYSPESERARDSAGVRNLRTSILLSSPPACIEYI